MAITWSVYVDWDNDGNYTGTFDDITKYVKELSGSYGSTDIMSTRSAIVGNMEIRLDNSTRIFSTENTTGALYGKLIPRRSVQVVVNGTVFFTGYIEDIVPAGGLSGSGETKEATITCVDGMALLQNDIVVPIQFGVTGDLMVKAAFNTALLASVASQTITVAAGNVSNNDTLTITLTLGSTVTTYVLTFKTTLSGGANEIKIGAANTDTANNIAAAINRDVGSGTTYATSMTAIHCVTAGVSSNVTTLTSTIRGTYGNNIGLSTTAANITLGGATLTGGTDAFASMDIDTGRQTFDVVGDTWDGQSVNALEAISQITETERGWFGIRGDGTVFWKNRNYFFSRQGTAVQFDIPGGVSHDGKVSVKEIYNVVQVKYTPRAYLASGVVGEVKSVTTIPGQSGTTRWNGTVVYPGGGSIVVDMNFTDPTTGLPMAVKELALPITPTTDYLINDARDGSGFNYTTSNNVTFSIAYSARKAAISLANNALGPLYVTMLKLRGIGVVAYNPVTITREDSTSQTTYREKRLRTISFPLPADPTYAQSLADYELSRYKDAKYRLSQINLGKTEKLGGLDAWTMQLGSTYTITDNHIGFSQHKYLFVGLDFSIRAGPGNDHELNHYVYRLDDVSYWILEDATYGVLGTTTRLAV